MPGTSHNIQRPDSKFPLPGILVVAVSWLLCGVGQAIADEPSTAQEWRWTVLESTHYFSRIELQADGQPRRIYELDCDVNEESGESDFSIHETNRVDIVTLDGTRNSLLVVVCNQGAHSRAISVYEIGRGTSAPAWDKVGSYFADWQKVGSDLCLSYDRPCTETSCEQPFETKLISWNALKNEGVAACGA